MERHATLREKVETDIANLPKREELEYSLRLTEGTVVDDTATVIAYQQTSFQRLARRHTEVAWQTIHVVPRGARVAGIVSLDDRDYMKTELQSTLLSDLLAQIPGTSQPRPGSIWWSRRGERTA